jgi:hypothetical protein
VRPVAGWPRVEGAGQRLGGGSDVFLDLDPERGIAAGDAHNLPGPPILLSSWALFLGLVLGH